MGIQNWTFLLVGLSFSLYIGLAIWTRAKSTKDFYVAGGHVSPLANGLATAAVPSVAPRNSGCGRMRAW